MADKPSQRELARFIPILDGTDRWLDETIGRRPLAPRLRTLAGSLRRYVRHCRKLAWQGTLTSDDLTRRRAKVDTGVFKLWEAAQDRDW